MPSGCNMCNSRDSLALVACLFISLLSCLFVCLYSVQFFLKLGHNNHGLHIYYSGTGPPTSRRNNGPSTGRRNNGPSASRIINGPYIGRMIDWPNMGQTDRIMAINGLELESSVHGPTITGHR